MTELVYGDPVVASNTFAQQEAVIIVPVDALRVLIRQGGHAGLAIDSSQLSGCDAEAEDEATSHTRRHGEEV